MGVKLRSLGVVFAMGGLNLWLFVGGSAAFGAESGASVVSPTALEAVRFVTSDVDRFYRAVALARESGDPVAVIEREYLRRATPGLRYYDETDRLEDAARLWRTVEARWSHYEAVREFYERLPQAYSDFSKVYEFFEEYDPNGNTPPVYFIIGHFQGGATASPDGLVIALDNWAANWSRFHEANPSPSIADPAATLTHVVAHELVHYHQACSEDCGSLLDESLMEGGADFIAYLITGSRTNPYMNPIYEYYEAHAGELWPLFRKAMNGTELEPWLYAGEWNGRPGNLGYALGFAIVESYYERHPDKSRAVRDILGIKDGAQFLKESGFGNSTTDGPHTDL